MPIVQMSIHDPLVVIRLNLPMFQCCNRCVFRQNFVCLFSDSQGQKRCTADKTIEGIRYTQDMESELFTKKVYTFIKLFLNLYKPK